MAKSAPNGEFLETAVLDTLVPAASHSDIAEVLASATQDEGGIPTSLLPSVEQRSLLFFGQYIKIEPRRTFVLLILRSIDELVAVYVVLRVSNVSETALKAYLSGLSIRLDAFAISGHDAEAQESQGANDNSPRERDLIYSGEVQDTTDPLIMVHEADPDAQNGSEGGVPHMFVLWKANAFLSEQFNSTKATFGTNFQTVHVCGSRTPPSSLSLLLCYVQDRTMQSRKMGTTFCQVSSLRRSIFWSHYRLTQR